ncbi:MAG: hypothetical protein JEZ11_03665 [Desulfobacterales bacterium]|nr:hypothetical protein [Desulfobacterales bacterium]
MIKLLNNRDLAESLGINLARWKRWSREFLPPDPLAGKQAGYARQYYLNDAFTVFLGGCFVSELGFSIPDARMILADLDPWLNEKGFRGDARGKTKTLPGLDEKVQYHTVNIVCQGGEIIGYRLVGTITDEPFDLDGHGVRKSFYTQETIQKKESNRLMDRLETEKTLNLTSLLKTFLNCIDPTGQFFSRNGQ